jgi:glycosyltransferase involved in cell wall biosynthesis
MNSLIVPVYKNADTIEPLVAAVGALATRLMGNLEVVFVVDGSPDDSYKLLKHHLASCPFQTQIIQLARNFGSFAAIRTGMALASGEYFAVMAADLQEPTELVGEFFNVLATEEIDLVCGRRIDRNDPAASKFAASIFWWLYRHLVQPQVPPGGVDVVGCNKNVRDSLLKFEENNSSLIGQLFWLGFRRKDLAYTRQPRAGTGKSAWTFRKKWRYMVDSVFSFTDLPINMLIWLGTLGVVGSLALSAIVSTAWLAGMVNVLGYTPIMLVLAFSTSLNLLASGILGAYVWRTFENTKRRPLAIMMTQEHFPKGTKS